MDIRGDPSAYPPHVGPEAWWGTHSLRMLSVGGSPKARALEALPPPSLPHPSLAPLPHGHVRDFRRGAEYPLPMRIFNLSPTWADLIAGVLAVLVGWLGRTFTPSRKPAGSRPARRKP